MAAGKRDLTTKPTSDEGAAEPPWSVAGEIGVGHLGDSRLDRRLQTLVADLSARMGASLPFACQDWAATKAADRFLSNPLSGRGRHPRRPFRRDGRTGRGGPRSRAGPARHHRICLQARGTRRRGPAQPAPAPARSRRGRLPHAPDRARLSDALQLGPDPRRLAPGPGRRALLEPGTLQGLRRPQAPDQPDPGARGGEGELPLAGEHPGGQPRPGPTRAPRPCRRPRGRHVRVVLHGPGGEHPLPGAHLRGPAGRRGRAHHRRGHARA